jgi:hypothetical protein
MTFSSFGFFIVNPVWAPVPFTTFSKTYICFEFAELFEFETHSALWATTGANFFCKYQD